MNDPLEPVTTEPATVPSGRTAVTVAPGSGEPNMSWIVPAITPGAGS